MADPVASVLGTILGSLGGNPSPGPAPPPVLPPPPGGNVSGAYGPSSSSTTGSPASSSGGGGSSSGGGGGSPAPQTGLAAVYSAIANLPKQIAQSILADATGRASATSAWNTGVPGSQQPYAKSQTAAIAQAASHYGINPQTIWGVFGTESAFGKNPSTSSAGAQGPFQFIPSTWQTYSHGGNVQNFYDSLDASARLLKSLGANSDPNSPQTRQALNNYNGNGGGAGVTSYVNRVQQLGPQFPASAASGAAAAVGPSSAGGNPIAAPLQNAINVITGKKPKQQSFYANPFAQAMGLSPERIDMGVDYAAKAGSPIGALGAAKILNAASGGTGWTSPTNTQGGVVYQLLQGPLKGKDIFVTEDVAPLVKAGDVVKAGQPIAKFLPSGTGLETGWATGQGFGSLAASLGQQAHGGDPGAHASASGQNFSDLLHALGAPAGVANGAPSGTMPSGYFGPGVAGAQGTPLPAPPGSVGPPAPPTSGAPGAPAPSSGAPGGVSSASSGPAAVQQQQAQLAQLAQLQAQQNASAALQGYFAGNPGNLWNTMPAGLGNGQSFGGGSDAGLMSLLSMGSTGTDMLGLAQSSLQGLAGVPLTDWRTLLGSQNLTLP